LFINLENDESYNFGVSANHWDLNLILGGVRPDGIDGTNELTYLFLKVWGYLEVITPVIAVRLGKDSPQKLYEACSDILRYGSGEPVIYNEEPIIDGYVKLGIPIEDARDFTNDGCWETLIPGKSHYSYAHIEVLQLLEYVFQRGYSLVRKNNEGLDLGDLAQFKTFEDFYQAFKTQLYHQLDMAIDNRIKYYGASYKIAPDPMISTMIDGWIEKGKDLTDGGAQYTIFSPLLTGLSDCIDSLAAVKKIVYEDKAIPLEKLAKVQRENFEDQEPLRQMMINRAPKFGNDDEYVDSLLARLIKDFESRVEEISKKYPGIYMPLGIATFENFNKFGHKIGASASGRRSQEAVGSNFSPAFGADKEGPTAAVKSAVAADLKRFVTGCPLDMQVNSNETSGPEGLQRLCGFIKSFIQLGGLILTITGVNSEILIEAQKNPDKYRTLRVRMGGLSAYFIALPKVMQDTLIRKTKHRI
jgi:formate C-acetyltransferase